MSNKNKLKKLFEQPNLIEVLQEYDLCYDLCRQSSLKLNQADDNSEAYYELYWDQFYGNKEVGDRLYHDYDLNQLNRKKIDFNIRDDGDTE